MTAAAGGACRALERRVVLVRGWAWGYPLCPRWASCSSGSAPTDPNWDAAVEGALLADDRALVKECRVELKRGSGPGGQHKNKIESYVTLRHTPTGLSGQCGDHRKQELNMGDALERLRGALAYSVAEGIGAGGGGEARQVPPPPPPPPQEGAADPALARAASDAAAPVHRCSEEATSAAAALLKTGSKQRIGANNARYPLAVWRLLVELRERKGALAATAASLGTSTGQLNRVFAKDKRLLAAANTLRARHGLQRLVNRS